MLKNAALLSALSLCLSPLLPGASASAQEVQQTIRINTSDTGPLNLLPPGRDPKTGTSALRGRIVGGDTGSPVRRAQVRVSGPDIGTKSTLTDNQGRYEFKDLPAGRFNISVSKSGYVTMQYGQSRPFEPGTPIELVDAQVLDKVDVALPRGGVLAGRIVDETGESVADADVTAMRMQFQNGKRRLVPSGRNATTNDLGQFRIYGLPPGDYFVSASLHNLSSMMVDFLGPGAGGSAGSNQESGYASTYYPSTPNPAEAQRVTLTIGQELASVDIQLQPVRLAKITGMALGSDGKPMSGAMVMLLPSAKDALMLLPAGTSRTDKNGNFTLNGVTPGDYSLQLQSGGAMFQSAGGAVAFFSMKTPTDDPSSQSAGPAQREFGSAALTVSGDDITGLVVTGTRGAKAAGTIKFDRGAHPDGATNVRVTAPATDDTAPMPSMGMSSVKDDGTFEIEGLAGTHIFRVANPPRGWTLKSITYNGEDVTDRGIEFRPGEDVSGIEIALTSSVQTVIGTVSSDTAEPVKNYTVVIFADDPQKWPLMQNRWVTSARPDQDGRYRVTSLPPGHYYAIAVDYVAQGEWQDPEWLARAAKKATAFTLDEGVNKTLDLKLAGT
ncbi:MAG TPA: carboxypeptidase-like regulatory domain-containing protein [Vicinamibacterales bacterium]